MIIIWCAICALCTAWVAGDLLLGSVVAKQLFYYADAEGVGRAFAGLVFGDVLRVWTVIAELLCVLPAAVLLAIAAGRGLKQRGIGHAWLPLAAIVILLTAHSFTTYMVKSGWEKASELRAHPDPVASESFRTRFHFRSKVVIGFEMIAALGVAIGAAIAAKKAGTEPAGRRPAA